jgi:NADPH-dependent 2,4-dienoyl-CoA reductase/sulfur reductase-like enzyme
VSGPGRRLRDIGEMPSIGLERPPPRPRRDLGTYREPARELSVRDRADVVVVGGGPAGTAAAAAAARLGADVLLIERYGQAALRRQGVHLQVPA